MPEHIAVSDLWKRIQKQSKDRVRKLAAVAYVSSDSVLAFRDGDIVVCNASDQCVGAGETSAKVLKAAHKRGAELYHLPQLHAKLMVLGPVAVIGSANISENSRRLVEAAFLSDDAAVVAKAAAIIHQLKDHAQRIDGKFLERISKIQVSRRRDFSVNSKPPKLREPTDRTWLVSLLPLDDEKHPDEQVAAEKGQAEAEERKSRSTYEIGSIRYVGRSKFRQEAEEGNNVIQIWREPDRRPVVYRHAPIVLRDDDDKGKWTRFYVEEPRTADSNVIPWSSFKKLARRAGLPSELSFKSTRELTSAQSTALQALWNEFVDGT